MVAWTAVIDELETPSDGQQSQGAPTGSLPLIKLREVTAQNQYTNCLSQNTTGQEALLLFLKPI